MPLDMGGADRALAFTFGAAHTQRAWGDRRSVTWSGLATMLTKHERGPKEGSCIVPAVFRRDRRHKADANQIDIVVLDADCGHTLDEIKAAVGNQGWAAIVHSTHSHLTTTTLAKCTHWDQFFTNHPNGDAADFLRSKGYLARVADGAEPAECDDDGYVLIRHSQCPKFRIVLRLSRSWRASDYPDQSAANSAWKERIEALAAALGLSHDQSCTDTSRLFYLPRCPGDGREPVAAIIDGADCDIWSLPACVTARGEGLFAATSKSRGVVEEYADPATGEIIDLVGWAKSFGQKFEIVKALKARRPSSFIGHVTDGGHHHIRCINEDAHTSAEADRATFIVNASEANNKGFVIHCRHAHCTGMDRIQMIRLMLDQSWLQVSDLTDADFLLEDQAGPEPSPTKTNPSAAGTDWGDPLDFLADADLTGTPELKPEHIPEAIAPFVFDTAARMGVDPAAVALAALVSLASVADDAWCIQPKQNDSTWTENARLWGAIVGDPSMLKTPVVKATTAPIDKMEAAARERHEADMQRYRQDVKAWKDADGDPAEEPKAPRLDRWLVEGATTEAISEVLRDDPQAKQRAPAQKVLIRQDEMSEWIASFDRYRSGGKGGSDRGAYLRLYNGGRYTIDRVNRGAFAIPNWSACILGGIQPGPIRQIAKDAADDGLLQRFCYCVPAAQSRGEDRRPDAVGLARYAALFPALAAMHPGDGYGGEARRVVLHVDAHRHRLGILDMAEAIAALPDTSNRLKAALGKWPGLWARLTLAFHLIGRADARARGTASTGDVANVANAAAATATRYMRDILLPHLLRAEAVMFATEQTGHACWIAGFILSSGNERIAARDIIQAYRAFRAPENRRELLAVMDSLEAMGWVRPETQLDGRPPVAWRVNPKVHSHFAERAKQERARREAVKKSIYEAASQHLKKNRTTGC